MDDTIMKVDITKKELDIIITALEADFREEENFKYSDDDRTRINEIETVLKRFHQMRELLGKTFDRDAHQV